MYDVLKRTAASQGTDINGALLYLIEVPKVPVVPLADDEE